MKTISVEITGTVPLLQNRFPVEEQGMNKSKAKKKEYDPEVEAKHYSHYMSDNLK